MNKEERRAYNAAYYRMNKENWASRRPENKESKAAYEAARTARREAARRARRAEGKEATHRYKYAGGVIVLTGLERKAMFDALGENPTCEICDHPIQFGVGGTSRNAAHLDHCHATGAFRGWLCGRCNTGLGKLGDNTEGLTRALAYLNRGGLA